MRNADGLRRSLQEGIDVSVPDPGVEEPQEMAPLLRKLLEEYSATGLPPAYLPKTTKEES
jgi:hypothetical protein